MFTGHSKSKFQSLITHGGRQLLAINIHGYQCTLPKVMIHLPQPVTLWQGNQLVATEKDEHGSKAALMSVIMMSSLIMTLVCQTFQLP